MNLLKGLFGGKNKPKVATYLPIAKLDAKSVGKLRQDLLKLKKGQTHCLLVGLSVSKGSLVQSEIAALLLRQTAEKLDVPLVMYCEEAAIATGMHLLVHGDVVLCNPSSMLGNVGFAANPTMLKEFIKEWHFQIKVVTKGENKARLNRFEPHRQEDVDWMLNLLNSRVDGILEKIKERRGDKAFEFASTAEYCMGQEALEHGLVD